MTEKSALCRLIFVSREVYKQIYSGTEDNTTMPFVLDSLSNALSHIGSETAPLSKIFPIVRKELKSADGLFYRKVRRYFSLMFSAVDFDAERAARLAAALINGSDSVCAALLSDEEKARDMAQAMSGLCGVALGEYDGLPKEKIYPLIFGYYEKKWGEPFLQELSDMI